MFSETEWAKNEVEKKGYNCGEKRDKILTPTCSPSLLLINAIFLLLEACWVIYIFTILLPIFKTKF